jgi:hypothetical protein
MSTSSFGRLVSIELRHPYFADGVVRRARFVEPAHTQALMRAGRLQSRLRDGAWHLLVERTGGAPRVALAAGTTLWLGVQFDAAALANVTAPLAPPGRSALFGNVAAFDALDAPQPVQLAAGVHALPLTSSQRPLTVTLRHVDGTALAQTTVRGDDVSAALDLRALATGTYFADEDDGVAPMVRNALFVHPALQGAHIDAVVGLRLSPALYGAAQPPLLHIDLAAPAERLEYYVVARNFGATEFGQLAVSDLGFTEDARPRIEFDRIESSAFNPATELAPALLGAEPGARIALFRSRSGVPRRERARRRLQLARNNGADVLIDHLPQPDAARSQPQFVIHLSKP